ncbi:hypothetical protein ABE493_07745 [Stenotrophomonas terrae]|uniref:hypothetical protein n=1 Tax=Stenotrophomonas terrae TaxID=405446 RepID=UPI003209FDD9
MKEAQALQALAQALAEKIERKAAREQQNSTLSTPSDYECIAWNDPTRQLCLQRIRLLTRAYQLDWLVQQHLLTRPSLEALSNRQLRMLLADAEQAREAISEGFPLEHTGLITNVAAQLPEA